uniref:Uncharacterized protein n=1 Tax=Anguilla anguilla TaxID=7936 RepID=A0A0E9PQ19_ANGAN
MKIAYNVCAQVSSAHTNVNQGNTFPMVK